MGRLDQRSALVTGGASGLGKAIARRLSADGARVVITDIQGELGRNTAAEYGFTFLEQDVCDEGRWTEVIGEVEERFGRLDILVNNAGILGPMHTISPENTPLSTWRTIFAVNVDGVFLGCRAAIPAMRRSGGGSIINMSSVAGLLATPYATAYGASKAAVRQLTKSVAQYCAEQKLNIRCNSVHPGNVRTPLWDRQAEEVARLRGVPIEDIYTEARDSSPLGDFTQPEDIAAAVSFLASEDARHITGIKLLVDAGTVNCDTFRPASARHLPAHQSSSPDRAERR
jgi:NAD(P)-dependent dehydrogenase (short-subunit alcohol dehydrogenase family)